MKESLKVLQECAELQTKKSNDYQNPNSNIRQADYYPRGVASLLDIVHAKTLRMFSVLEAMENDPKYKPNFESLEDSAKDLINYGSFIAAYIRGGIDGQDPDRVLAGGDRGAPRQGRVRILCPDRCAQGRHGPHEARVGRRAAALAEDPRQRL